jgi:hypothetical protein
MNPFKAKAHAYNLPGSSLPSVFCIRPLMSVLPANKTVQSQF